MSSLLDVQNIECRYGDKVIIADLSFAVSLGQIVCLLGPSGCGKTTVLRAIAGFEPIYRGSILLEGNILSTPESMVPPEQRQIGMVFQDYALFPHLKVRENIGFGLRDKSTEESVTAVDRLLTLVKLEDHADAYPHQLSGGQQQRVALARALAPNPRVLLMDEPFSSLDTELRRSLSLEVRNILKQQGTSAILVTHDQTEAFNMADEIGVMHEGALQQWGTAQTLFHQPANRLVANFICNGRFIRGRVTGEGQAETVFGEIAVPNITELPPGTPLNLLVRPWDLAAADADGDCHGEVIQQQFHGAATATSVRLDDGTVVETNDPALASSPLGTQVRLRLTPDTLLGFPA